MNIGIIGAGRMGSGLGKLWAQKGHKVLFSARHPEKVKELARSIGPNASGGTVAEAARFGEAILVATPWTATADALKSAGQIRGKVVIDCTNPLKPDLSDLAVGHTSSAAEEIAELTPDSNVVKAFNTVFAEVYHTDFRLFGSRVPTMFYCGDEGESKRLVKRLISEVGFEPVDAGPLSSARYLEPLAMLMIRLGYGQGMGTNISLSLIRR